MKSSGTTNTMTDLARRCEDTDGADRMLDGEIAKSLAPELEWFKFHDTWCSRDPYDLASFNVSPRYTASIDAALTLVPEGWDYGVQDHREDGAYAEVWKHGYHDDTVLRAHAATPALALCAAALRARIQAGGEGQ